MNDELRRLFEADQADRAGDLTDPAVLAHMAARDPGRLARVTEILDAGGAQTADDH